MLIKQIRINVRRAPAFMSLVCAWGWLDGLFLYLFVCMHAARQATSAPPAANNNDGRKEMFLQFRRMEVPSHAVVSAAELRAGFQREPDELSKKKRRAFETTTLEQNKVGLVVNTTLSPYAFSFLKPYASISKASLKLKAFEQYAIAALPFFEQYATAALLFSTFGADQRRHSVTPCFLQDCVFSFHRVLSSFFSLFFCHYSMRDSV